MSGEPGVVGGRRSRAEIARLAGLYVSVRAPAVLCAFVTEQLGIDPLQFGDYGERDQTRREHVLEIQTALALRPLTRSM
jgi:hypothetical protein